jgi:hypothetical protein
VVWQITADRPLALVSPFTKQALVGASMLLSYIDSSWLSCYHPCTL